MEHWIKGREIHGSMGIVMQYTRGKRSDDNQDEVLVDLVSIDLGGQWKLGLMVRVPSA